MVRVRGAQISLLVSPLTTWLAVMWLVTVTMSPGAYWRTITPLANFPPGASCSCDQSELSTGAAQPITAHLDRGVPRVAADPAPAPDGRAPLVTLAAAETLHPVVVWRRISSSAFYISSPSVAGLFTCGVVREAVVVHDCPGGGLHHAAVPPHLPHQHRHHGHHRTLLGQHWWDLDSFGLLKQLAFALARLL